MLSFEAIRDVNDFFEDISRYGFNHEFSEFNFSRGQKSYENILKRLEKIELPNPLDLKYQVLSLEELSKILLEILCKIFGNEFKEKFEYFNSLLVLKNIEDPFDAIVETELKGENQVPCAIYISSKCYSIQVASTAHEYIHGLLSPYDTTLFNSKINNVHYKELLPIIVEYIVCYELSKLFKSDNLELRHDLIRIYHNQQQALERHAGIYCVSSSNKFDPLDASF